MGLGSFPQACFGEFFDGLSHVSQFCDFEANDRSYIFFAILISRYVNSAKGTTTYLLLDNVLIDAVLSTSIILTGNIF